jgi:hypothetical protein
MTAGLRRLAALVVACAALPFMAAITGFTPPVVVVYPLTVTSGADPEAGANIAVLLAQRLSQAGGLKVKPYPPGTKRADFLTTANTLGADYYITGFLTPLGDQVSLVTQIVSCASGTVIFSNTTLVRTYEEAGGQSDILHEALLRHAGRGFASLENPQPKDTPVPTPPAKNETNLTGLFKRKKKATPTPTPSVQASNAPAEIARAAPATPVPGRSSPPRPIPTPAVRTVARVTPTPRPLPVRTSAPPPAPSAAPIAPVQVAQASQATPHPSGNAIVKLRLAAAVLVLDVAGGDGADIDAYAQDALVGALQHAGTTAAGLPAPGGDLPARAREFCNAAFGAKTIYAPTLSFDRDSGGQPNGVELDVAAFDCAGNPAGREHTRARIGRGNVNAAIDRAAADMVSAFAFANQPSR